MRAEDRVSEEHLMALVADLCASDPQLTPVGAALLAALHLAICSDSRTFSRMFGIAHALVLREVAELSGARGLIAVAGRDPRTQRTTIALTDRSSAFFLETAA